jgi:hypothetical protein
MFGDERGGEKNVKFGFKDMKNAEAQAMYYEEVRKMLRDVNARYLRQRFPDYSPEKVDQVLAELEASRGSHHGVKWSDLLRLPDRRFFRRKGEHAFEMIGIDGEAFTDVEEYVRYLAKNLNEGYVASRDMRNYVDVLRKVHAGEMTAADGAKSMPKLKRVGGTCPCSKGVRWVMEDDAGGQTTVAVRPN